MGGGELSEDADNLNPAIRRTRHAKSTKHDSRRNNLRTTLEVVSTQGATSRAEISRQTGLTRAAVSSLVAELIDSGLLRELGPGTSAGGKPPTLLGINERGRDIIAVDLGTRPFRAALVDLTGRIHERVESPDLAAFGLLARDSAIALISQLVDRSRAPVLGIGVGTPGVVDPGGRVVEAANLDWHGLELGAELRARFQLPVSITNDAQAAALAEFRRHSIDRENLIVVKLGRGIGAGLVIRGTLHRGDHAAAGEIGHVRVVEGGKPCTCGNSGCLETIASVPAILRAVGADPDRHPWDALALAGIAGEEPVRRALAEAGRQLGVVLASLVALLDVSHIVLAPELLNAGDVLADEVRASLRRRVLPATADLIEVEVSPLGSDLVLAGAASSVLADRLGVVLR
ncbi:MAG TPA: ROK family transcriptional regulator [Acidimicrobiia bacterium]